MFHQQNHKENRRAGCEPNKEKRNHVICRKVGETRDHCVRYNKVNQKKNPDVFFHVESRLNIYEHVYAYNTKVVERLVFERRKDVKGQRKVTECEDGQIM